MESPLVQVAREVFESGINGYRHDLDDAAPLLSALPFERVDPVSAVEPPAQGRDVENNEQHNHDEHFHNDLLFISH